MIDVTALTIKTAHDHLLAGDFSVRELAEAYLKNIAEKNSEINAYLEVYEDVLEQADKADKQIANGTANMLTGIPIAVKDNILIKGKKATSASKILQGYVAPYDSTVVDKLKKEGVVFLGRTNMDEFALGSSTENSAFGTTKNPHDTSRVPGGTSGGSAAAVASSMALAALGSDTGGSVRQPASLCGIVGLKPTYGRVSRFGLMAAASSFDQIGPLAKTVTDAEYIYNVIQGSDSSDSTTISDTLKTSKNKNIIGVPWDLISQPGVDKNVRNNFDESIGRLEAIGYMIKDIKFETLKYCLSIFYILNFAEVSSNLARFDGVKYGLHRSGKNLLEDYIETRGQGFGSEVRRRILLGTYVLSSGYYDAYYNKAKLAQAALQKEFIEAFLEVDLVIMPTSPIPAWKIGEKSSDPLSMYLADIFTVTANIVGIPAISLPSGTMEMEGKNLPLGLQFMAAHFNEKTLFDIGKKFLGE